MMKKISKGRGDMEKILVFPKRKELEKMPEVREAAEAEEALLERLFAQLDSSGAQGRC